MEPMLDDSLWPKEWKTTEYKVYDRFPQLDLPKPQNLDKTFSDCIRGRETARHFSNKTLSLQELSDTLFHTVGITDSLFLGGGKRRAQPSGGGLFPIEIYPLVLHGTKKIPSGIYHYNVCGHRLEAFPWKQNDAERLSVFEWAGNASVAFFMTAVFHRSEVKYRARGYRYALLEAGHIGQNFYLLAQALNLKCVALGGTNDENVEKLLHIDGQAEALVYTILIGK